MSPTRRSRRLQTPAPRGKQDQVAVRLSHRKHLYSVRLIQQGRFGNDRLETPVAPRSLECESNRSYGSVHSHCQDLRVLRRDPSFDGGRNEVGVQSPPHPREKPCLVQLNPEPWTWPYSKLIQPFSDQVAEGLGLEQAVLARIPSPLPEIILEVTGLGGLNEGLRCEPPGDQKRPGRVRFQGADLIRISGLVIIQDCFRFGGPGEIRRILGLADSVPKGRKATHCGIPCEQFPVQLEKYTRHSPIRRP